MTVLSMKRKLIVTLKNTFQLLDGYKPLEFQQRVSEENLI
jgi:hypothetical protein